MVGFMRWVHKKSLLFLVAVLIPALCGSIYFLSNLRTTKFQGSVTFIQPKPRIICFNSNELKTTMTLDLICPPTYTFLGDGPLVESATANGVVSEIHPLLLTRFKTAAAFAKADGVRLFITSGFRTLDRQAFLFNREVEIRGSESEAAKWVLPPQYSHHPRGLAIDVNYPGDRLGALWLEENGSRFGLCRVYANEWWHFEGVIAPGQACPPLAPNALVDLK
jgi:hypothetical protein